MDSEKLNLWDRIFNRYKRIVIEEGKTNFHKVYSNDYGAMAGQIVPNSGYSKSWVKYKIIDRVTGSEKIKIEYLT